MLMPSHDFSSKVMNFSSKVMNVKRQSFFHQYYKTQIHGCHFYLCKTTERQDFFDTSTNEFLDLKTLKTLLPIMFKQILLLKDFKFEAQNIFSRENVHSLFVSSLHNLLKMSVAHFQLYWQSPKYSISENLKKSTQFQD